MRRELWLAIGWGVLLASCGGDDESDDTETLVGAVFLTDNESALAGISVRAVGSRKVATTDQSGRFSVEVPRGSSVRLEGSNVAPITRENWRTGNPTLRMKAFDGFGAVSATLGGSVRADSGAAVRIPPGVLEGAATADLGLAAPDPRNGAGLRAVTGSFRARSGQATGRVSVVSPIYVGARLAGPAVRTAANSQIDVDFPSWQAAANDRFSLFAFDGETEEWSRVSSVAAMQNERGVNVFRGVSDRLGWLAVGEFYSELSCVKGCAHTAEGGPEVSAEAAATGSDHFSQTLGTTDTFGCFELQVRANATFVIEVRTTAGKLLQTSASSGAAGAACTDVGILRPGGATTVDAASSSSDAGATAEVTRNCAPTGTLPRECV